MSIDIVEAFTAKNKCYQAGAPLRPQGLMLHSIGTPQPSAAVLARYFDQYQPGGQSVCVHAFVQADGTVYQTLPWEMRGWHCGGTANSTHIGIEMTEPSAGVPYAEAAEQITGTYRAAVALFAQLCGDYGLDPLADGVIIGTQSGTTGFTYASGDFGDEKVKGFTKTTDAVAALINGQVDCVMLDNEPAKALVAANPDAGLSILDTAYTVEDYAIAINKQNTDLLNQINAALAELKADGTLQGIIDQYIK